jgi:hypothetical protein
MKLSVRWLVFGLLLSITPAVLTSPSAAQIGIGISVRIGPPALPVYEQPICPGPGYLWTPGYWAWSDDDGYYWVPGTWVEAPEPGFLWTPGYWGWNDGVYLWNAGYWGPQVGFYGGINYGFGYGGEGFYGGEWREGRFFYNTAVTRVDTVRITNVYVNRTVIVHNESHVAFNGGPGGVRVRPTPQQVAYAHESHHAPVAAQLQHEHAASQNRALFASQNHGRPAVAATARPGDFKGHVVAAKAAGAPYHAPAISPKQARASAPAGNHAAANRPANTSRPETNNRANSARPNTAHANESHAAKPFTPPPSSHASNAPHNQTSARQSSPHSETAPRTQSAHPSSQTRAQSAPRPAPQPHQSAPRESAPRESHSAPSPPHQAAPPAKHESAPPKEHKGG